MNTVHLNSLDPSTQSVGEVVVSIQDVDFSYAPGERQILSGLNMEFRRGQVVAVMGGSGCGKTTILRLIGGQFTAQSGQVLFEGRYWQDE
jgi:phospholipid/cholesterol/gamma-HCH transport system ATP-binding protein